MRQVDYAQGKHSIHDFDANISSALKQYQRKFFSTSLASTGPTRSTLEPP